MRDSVAVYQIFYVAQASMDMNTEYGDSGACLMNSKHQIHSFYIGEFAISTPAHFAIKQVQHLLHENDGIQATLIPSLTLSTKKETFCSYLSTMDHIE